MSNPRSQTILASALPSLAMVLLVACQPSKTTPPDTGEGGEATAAVEPYPGMLVDPSTVERDFLMRQKLSGEWRGRRLNFEAVVQKQGDTLTVIGLSPFGTKAFLLTQTGTKVAFENFIDRELPFPPKYMLQDIHRIFLYESALPWGSSGPDGTSTAEVADETVVDRWEAGTLHSRTFTRVDGRPEGSIRVDYGEGMNAGVPPEKLVFDNGWFGYKLTIQTVQYQTI